MKTLTPLLVFALAAAAISFAGPPPHKPGEYIRAAPPIGLLGYPIGTYLTIEGVGVGGETNLYGSHTHALLVDKIGDYTLTNPIAIWIKNVESPQSGRCVLRGFESGAWSGSPPGVIEAVSSKNWSFDFYFIATFIEQPPTLKLQMP